MQVRVNCVVWPEYGATTEPGFCRGWISVTEGVRCDNTARSPTDAGDPSACQSNAEELN